MPRIFQLVACLLTSLIVTDAFLVSTDDKIHQMTTNTRLMAEIPSSTPETSRRELLLKATAVFGSAVLSNVVFPFMAVADADDSGIPMLTTDEFFIILRDSSKSIQRVEFSGPKAETVLVKLIDGTKFGLSDIIESSTDPRSPLKIQAACREYKGMGKINNCIAFCVGFSSYICCLT